MSAPLPVSSLVDSSGTFMVVLEISSAEPQAKKSHVRQAKLLGIKVRLVDLDNPQTSPSRAQRSSFTPMSFPSFLAPCNEG